MQSGPVSEMHFTTPCARHAVPLLLATTRRPPRCGGCALSAASDAPLDAVGAVLNAGATTVAAVAGFGLLALALALGVWLFNEQYVLDLRRRRYKGAGSSKSRGVDPSSPAYVRPRELWRLSELRRYDGSESPDGPVLLAARGLVFNVARARNFYGPGGEYEVMGGADATRYLARNSVEPETAEQAAAPLSLAQQAALSAWLWSLEQKYDVVGRLATAEEAERMGAAEQRREAYLDRMEEMSSVMETRDLLEVAWGSSAVGADSGAEPEGSEADQ